MATALAMFVALTPAAGVLLVGRGPGTRGCETVLASGGHLHSHGSAGGFALGMDCISVAN